ncbi:hypothetical protein LDL63_11095 [Ensifer adhaerens]|uniref:alpha-glutamyl/putrescinyl thymine pyrophosphorylase clade 3 protein n=2 Tax=Ensifer adhaerens TaxID=106592 RepID=UPI001C4E1989|nr:hypothetical protein [Ensifer adhaerens]MBW0366650.1 hypothetical protein [Ensifer adhaerens]UCM18405.1 hypothetical protein LDL63_11095 [Ensifer adhaerens]
MWPKRQAEHRRLADALLNHTHTTRALPGAGSQEARDTLAMQFIASLRREDYYRLVQQKVVDARKADPNSGTFDPERAVAYHMQQGDIEAASWLIFLMTEFARPASGWQRLQDVYGMLGAGTWDWNTVSANPQTMIDWLAANWQRIGGKFGNHRKYESLRPDSNRSFEKVLRSYLNWIGQDGHARFFADVVRNNGNDPGTLFNVLYKGMNVVTFGRLARFDYLALIGRYGIAPIEAASAYLNGATGPLGGVRLLFTGSTNDNSRDRNLQSWLDDLDRDLNVGMAVMEDALCNWQKSPTSFVHYKG